MPHDPIRLLRLLRRRSVEQARSALGACLAAENEAAERISAIDDAARRDRAARAELQDAHRFQDMFVRRIDVRNADRRAAEAGFAAAQARSAAAREAVVAARTAAEGVETLIDERAAAEAAVAARGEQHALDDMARARFDSMTARGR
jgi:flagellar export protein FliJ